MRRFLISGSEVRTVKHGRCTVVDSVRFSLARLKLMDLKVG